MFGQEAGDVVWGHINGALALNSGVVAISGFTIFGTIHYFLVTDVGLMSSNFAIETLVFVHKLFLFSIRVCLSHSAGINIHGMSSLRGGAWSGSSVSSVLIASPLVWFRHQSKGSVKSLFLLTELRGGQPLLVRFSGLFFPFLEGPWSFCVWVEIGGVYDCSGEWWFHSMFKGFDGSFVI